MVFVFLADLLSDFVYLRSGMTKVSWKIMSCLDLNCMGGTKNE